MPYFNHTRSRRIAAAYDAMPHDPDRPDVARAYAAFKRETYGQYQAMVSRPGMLQVEWTPVNPYITSKDLFTDIDEHARLRVYRGGDLPADHPLAEWIGNCTYNDLFRAVHDYYGHYVPRVGFGPKGEDAAWHNHSRMFSPLAKLAMTTETRGQNSWFVEHNKAGQETKVYAPQKAGILPDFAFATD